MTDIPRTSPDRFDFKDYYFQCECSTPEHDIRFTFDTDRGDLYMSVHLHQYRRWYQRIWIAIKYIFGHQSQYGVFDSTIIRKEDAPRLIALLKTFHDHKP